MLLLQVSCDNFCSLASIIRMYLKVHAGAVKSKTDTLQEQRWRGRCRGEENGTEWRSRTDKWALADQRRQQGSELRVVGAVSSGVCSQISR